MTSSSAPVQFKSSKRLEACVSAGLASFMFPLVVCMAMLVFAAMAIDCGASSQGFELALGKVVAVAGLGMLSYAALVAMRSMRSGWRAPQGVGGVQWVDAARMRGFDAIEALRWSSVVLAWSFVVLACPA